MTMDMQLLLMIDQNIILVRIIILNRDYLKINKTFDKKIKRSPTKDSHFQAINFRNNNNNTSTKVHLTRYKKIYLQE